MIIVWRIHPFHHIFLIFLAWSMHVQHVPCWQREFCAFNVWLVWWQAWEYLSESFPENLSPKHHIINFLPCIVQLLCIFSLFLFRHARKRIETLELLLLNTAEDQGKKSYLQADTLLISATQACTYIFLYVTWAANWFCDRLASDNDRRTVISNYEVCIVKVEPSVEARQELVLSQLQSPVPEEEVLQNQFWYLPRI